MGGAWTCQGNRAEFSVPGGSSSPYPLPSLLWKTHSRRVWFGSSSPTGGHVTQDQLIRDSTLQAQPFTEGRAGVCVQANYFSLIFVICSFKRERISLHFGSASIFGASTTMASVGE